jgi:hypothetical protein
MFSLDSDLNIRRRVRWSAPTCIPMGCIVCYYDDLDPPPHRNETEAEQLRHALRCVRVSSGEPRSILFVIKQLNEFVRVQDESRWCGKALAIVKKTRCCHAHATFDALWKELGELCDQTFTPGHPMRETLDCA